jgi:hypothetical protein
MLQNRMIKTKISDTTVQGTMVGFQERTQEAQYGRGCLNERLDERL